MFLWRLAHHSLPTFDVLHKRNMLTVHRCPMCGGEDSWRHALISCTMARCIWALSGEEVVDHMDDNKEPNAKNVNFDMHECLSQEQFSLMVVTLWSILYVRRKVVYEVIFQSPNQTHPFINNYMLDLRSLPKLGPVGTVAATGPVPRVAAVQRWLPPLEDHMKLNIDGQSIGRDSVEL